MVVLRLLSSSFRRSWSVSSLRRGLLVSMTTASRVILGIVAVAGSLGLAGALWVAIVPNEKRMEEMDKEFHKSNPRLWTKRQEQNALIMAALKEAAETNENVASKPQPWKK